MLGDITAGPAYKFTQWLELVRKRSGRYRYSGFPRRPSGLDHMLTRFFFFFFFSFYLWIECIEWESDFGFLKYWIPWECNWFRKKDKNLAISSSPNGTYDRKCLRLIGCMCNLGIKLKGKRKEEDLKVQLLIERSVLVNFLRDSPWGQNLLIKEKILETVRQSSRPMQVFMTIVECKWIFSLFER